MKLQGNLLTELGYWKTAFEFGFGDNLIKLIGKIIGWMNECERGETIYL